MPLTGDPYAGLPRPGTSKLTPLPALPKLELPAKLKKISPELEASEKRFNQGMQNWLERVQRVIEDLQQRK